MAAVRKFIGPRQVNRAGPPPGQLVNQLLNKRNQGQPAGGLIPQQGIQQQLQQQVQAFGAGSQQPQQAGVPGSPQSRRITRGPDGREINPPPPPSERPGFKQPGLGGQNSVISPPVGSTGNRTTGSALVQPSLGGGADNLPVRPEIPGDRNIPGGFGASERPVLDGPDALPGDRGLNQRPLGRDADPVSQTGGQGPSVVPSTGNFAPRPQTNAVATAKDVPITSESVPMICSLSLITQASNVSAASTVSTVKLLTLLYKQLPKR